VDILDRSACYRALQTRDARFDGRLFVGVTSTGIYCRPICPARTPKPENCLFFPTAAAAQGAGFRPCLRCRPETAPEVASWRGTSNTVSRALALIADGGLDGPRVSVEMLADRVGVGARQLRRLFDAHLGTSPVVVAQTRRVLFAKQLVQETRMPLADVALAAGFGSIRRFNETFQQLFGRPPGSLRRRRASDLEVTSDAGVSLRIRYRPPYDWAAMLTFLEARAIDGVEEISHGVYRRTVAVDGHGGTVEVRNDPARQALAVSVQFPCVRALSSIVARVRRVFDLGADIETIGAHLSRDPLLARLVSRRPGLRAPGGWDGFEQAARTVLGQQITVRAARRLASQLVTLCGVALPLSSRRCPALTRIFPSPAQVASADLRSLGMPVSRQMALKAIAEAALVDPDLFRPSATMDEAITRLRLLDGIGEWTAQYIAMRALGETDAFPATDRGLLRGAAQRMHVDVTPAALLEMAQSWRPWRAYAAQHLWMSEEVADHR
jgi:AraC family transcriptional regulator of adaptative response / DNA-3-methyladenine glycosylase II